MSNPETIRVFIVDDHPLVREGLSMLLNKASGFECVGQADGNEGTVAQVAAAIPDVVIMDVSLPNESGIALTRRVAKEIPEAKVLIVSMHDESEFVQLAFRAGAAGYLTKNSPSDEILEALRVVSRGERFVGSALVKSLVGKDLDAIAETAHENFGVTDREREVLQFVARGLSAKEIGTELNISHRTVETHRTNLMKKLGAKNSAELVRLGTDMGLIGK